MSFSLNEVEVTARKAARGAGYPWGLAEEAGRATRWLCAQGLPGCESLAALLDADLAAALQDHMPGSLESPWRGRAELCPLGTGAALSDSAARVSGGTLDIADVAQPMLFLPFVAAAARRLETALSLAGPGFTAVTDAQPRCRNESQSSHTTTGR